MFLEEKKLGPLVETKPESEELTVLRRARALIAGGWTQGAYMSVGFFGRRYCAVGAIAYSAGLVPGLDTSTPAMTDARRALRTASGMEYYEGIETWNDNPRRTKQEVLAAFDRAIASLE